MRPLIVLACCGIYSLALSSASADQIVLKNGDRATGTILKKDAKNVTVKTDYFGTITAAWDQVASISTSQPVTIVLEDGRTVRGTLATANGIVEVAAESGRLNVAPAALAGIRGAEEQRVYQRLQKPGLTELWAGTASLGLAGAAGNARTLTFTTAVNAARVTNSDKTSLYFNVIKASALVSGRSADTAQAVRGGIGYDHNLS